MEFYDIRLARIGTDAFSATCTDLPSEYSAVGTSEQEAWDQIVETIKIWRDSHLIPPKELPTLDMHQLDQVV